MGLPTPTDPTDPTDPVVVDPTATISPTVARAFAFHLSGGTKSASSILFRDASNVQHPLVEGWVRLSSGLKQFFSPLAITLSRYTTSGARNVSGTTTVTTASVTAQPAGGAPPYTYAWTRTDGGGHAWTITSPTAAATTFSTSVARGVPQTANFKCTVTDAAGTVVSSLDVTATCTNG
jgi:hypothetical protein